MKRSYLVLAVFCIGLWTLGGCSTDVDGMMSFVPSPGVSGEGETEEYVPAPDPGEESEPEEYTPAPIPGEEDETEKYVPNPGLSEEDKAKEHIPTPDPGDNGKTEGNVSDPEPTTPNPGNESKAEENVSKPQPSDEDKIEEPIPHPVPGPSEEDKTTEHTPEPEPEPEPVPEPKPEPEPAVFLTYTVISETEIDFEFSSPVTLKSLSFDPGLEIASVEEGNTVKVYMTEALKPGQRLAADILAEDELGNTINVLVPLLFKNNRVPGLLINELRTEFSKLNAEYIEFKMINAGNLGGLRVFAAWLNKNPMIYEFPPVEVEAGEYVILHLRTLEESCMDELGDNLDASGGTYSCPTARDLWIPGSSKLLHKTDAVYVIDQDDRVLDAIMLSETPDPFWNKSYFEEAAGFLFTKGAWKSPTGGICSPENAVSSTNVKTAITRSISRDETMDDTNTAAEWYVTANSGLTPGLPNNPKRFE